MRKLITRSREEIQKEIQPEHYESSDNEIHEEDFEAYVKRMLAIQAELLLDIREYLKDILLYRR